MTAEQAWAHYERVRQDWRNGQADRDDVRSALVAALDCIRSEEQPA